MTGKGTSLRLAGTMLAVIVGLGRVSAGQTSPWRWASPLPQGNDLNAVVFGGDRFVAVGTAGTTLMSRDGLSWQVSNAGPGFDLRAVTWRESEFIAVGSGGSVFRSEDGLVWVAGTVGGAADLNGVACRSDRCVAVGVEGHIYLQASNGSWREVQSGTTLSLACAIWTGRVFVAAGDVENPAVQAPGVILTSLDGESWHATLIEKASFYRTLAAEGSTIVAGGAFCGPSPFGWCGYDFLVSVSDDGGSTWRTTFSENQPYLRAVVSTGRGFVGIGGNYRVGRSSDGVSWTWVTADVSDGALAHGNDTLVAVGWRGSLTVSKDGGTTWAPIREDSQRGNLIDIAWSGSRFVAAVGEWSPADALFTSIDGLHWDTVESLPPPRLSGLIRIVWNGLRFVLVDRGGILTSTDGLEWRRTASLGPGLIRMIDVGWTGSRWIATCVGQGWAGLVMSSQDGEAWDNPSALEGVYGIMQVTASRGVVIAMANLVDDWGACVLRSLDNGATWKAMRVPFGGALCAGDDRFVAVSGYPATSWVSDDGLEWTKGGEVMPWRARRVVWTGQEFVAVGEMGQVSRSSDGTSWALDATPTWFSLGGFAQSGDHCVVVGESNTILVRDCKRTLPPRRHLPVPLSVSSPLPTLPPASKRELR